MAHCLVTGRADFIGSHIVDELLARGETVRVLGDLSTGRLKNLEHCLDRIGFLGGDIRDSGICGRACIGVDFVLHQAALGSIPRSIDDPPPLTKST